MALAENALDQTAQMRSYDEDVTSQEPIVDGEGEAVDLRARTKRQPWVTMESIAATELAELRDADRSVAAVAPKPEFAPDALPLAREQHRPDGTRLASSERAGANRHDADHSKLADVATDDESDASGPEMSAPSFSRPPLDSSQRAAE